MYYTFELVGGERVCKIAERADLNSPWMPIRTIDEIHLVSFVDQRPVVTADELTLFWGSTRLEGSGMYVSIWQATRNSTAELFSNVTYVSELNIHNWNYGPCISPDGLTIYYSSYDIGHPWFIYKAIRNSQQEPFTNLQPLKTADNIFIDGIYPFVTPDENDLYFWSNFMGQGEGIHVSEMEKVEDYYWSEPINLIEGGASPCLTRDELTMYYFRMNTQGEPEIVEAHRDHPRDPFTTERIITELPGAAQPWLSADALRLYYMVIDIHGDRIIKLAERSDATQPWTPVRTISEIHVQDYDDGKPSLTEDELTIYWTSDQPPISGTPGIMMATRSLTSEPFRNVISVSELNLNTYNSALCILPDGLTAYFHSTNALPWDLYKATKSSPSAQESPRFVLR